VILLHVNPKIVVLGNYCMIKLYQL